MRKNECISTYEKRGIRAWQSDIRLLNVFKEMAVRGVAGYMPDTCRIDAQIKIIKNKIKYCKKGRTHILTLYNRFAVNKTINMRRQLSVGIGRDCQPPAKSIKMMWTAFAAMLVVTCAKFMP